MEKVLDVIETDRLLLRGIDENDSDSIVKWRSNPDVYKYFKSSHQITLQEHLNWYNIIYLNNFNRLDWICISKNNYSKIGVFGYSIDNDKAELNYILAPEEQHKGYAYEALSGIINYIKNNKRVHYIFAEIHESNMPSISLIRKLNFELVNNDGHFNVFELTI